MLRGFNSFFVVWSFESEESVNSYDSEVISNVLSSRHDVADMHTSLHRSLH